MKIKDKVDFSTDYSMPSPHKRSSSSCVWWGFCFLVLACFFSSGCILVPFIDSYKQSGVSQADRERLLEQTVTRFQRERFWGKGSGAVAFAEDESRGLLRNLMRDSRRKEKIVESEIEFVDFSEDAYEADVDVVVKYYEVPFYVVKERIENQKWKFSLSDGWRFSSLDIDGEPVDASIG